MSRWSNFKVEEIQQQIGDIQIQLKNLNSLDPSITAPMPDFPFEIARAREVLSFIDDYLKSIKPHLLKSGYSSQEIINQLNKISNSISQFQAIKNFGYITDINGYIDNILYYLSQNTFPTIQKTKTTTSLSSIIQSYEQNIENSLKNLDFPNVSKQIHSIDTAYRQILVDENSLLKLIQNTKSEIDKKLQEINEIKGEIENQRNLICDDSNGQESLMSQIENATNKAMEELEEIQKFKQTSQENNNAIQSTTDELQSFYYKVFGKEDENGKKIEGIEDKIKQREIDTEAKFSELKKDFEGFVQEEKAKLNAHYKQAKKAYEMTISGGLSKTFFEQAQEQKENVRQWDINFQLGLWVIAGITVGLAYYLGKDHLLDMSAFFIRIVFILPFVWYAFYASQRRAEAQRLAQEYTHKATTLQTYLLHKKEIEDLNEEDNELINKLINSSIDTVAFNPSSSLDKINKDKDYKNLIKDTKEIIKDTKEIIQELQTPKTQQGGNSNQ